MSDEWVKQPDAVVYWDDTLHDYTTGTTSVPTTSSRLVCGRCNEEIAVDLGVWLTTHKCPDAH